LIEKEKKTVCFVKLIRKIVFPGGKGRTSVFQKYRSQKKKYEKVPNIEKYGEI